MFRPKLQDGLENARELVSEVLRISSLVVGLGRIESHIQAMAQLVAQSCSLPSWTLNCERGLAILRGIECNSSCPVLITQLIKRGIVTETVASMGTPDAALCISAISSIERRAEVLVGA